MLNKTQSFSIAFLLLCAFVASADSDLNCISVGAFNLKYRNKLNGKGILRHLTRHNKIGQGGMGSVYKVRWGVQHKRSRSQKFVAVKRTIVTENNSSIADEIVLLELFNRLKLKHVAKYYGCFVTKDGSYNIVMEFLPFSLETVKSHEPLRLTPFYKRFLIQPPHKRLEIYYQIAEGLAEIHDLGWVHHDIKPSNLAYIPHAPNGLKIIDFGLAYAEGKGLPGGTSLYYDLQKQTYFDSRAWFFNKYWIKRRTDQWKADIWALGLTIYELENDGQGTAIDSQDNFNNDLKHDMQLTRDVVMDEEWYDKRDINICTPNKVVCFYDIMSAIMEVDRDDREITAHDIVLAFGLLLGKFPEPEELPKCIMSPEPTPKGFISKLFDLLGCGKRKERII